jgi:hypothetical protein
LLFDVLPVSSRHLLCLLIRLGLAVVVTVTQVTLLIPREHWTQPVGTLGKGEPRDGFMSVGEPTGLLHHNNGTVWRWIRLMDRLRFWHAEGTRAMFVRRADAQPWIEEIAALDPERRRTALTITKEMRRQRLAELNAEPAPEAEPLPMMPVEPEPQAPPVPRGTRAMSLRTACMAYDLPLEVLLRAVQAKDLPSARLAGEFYVRPGDLDACFQKHATR